MGIKRILILAGMALAAVAFAAPAVAQAEVVLTENKEPLEYEAKVTATSTNFIIITGVGTIKCNKVTLHFEVKTNNKTKHVVLDPLGGATTEGCSTEAFPVTITDGTVLTPLTINTWGTGHVATTLTYDIYENHTKHTENKPLLMCHLFGGAHVRGKESGSDTITVGASAQVSSGPGCPAQATVSGEFTLETTDGKPVELHYEETA